MKSGNGDGGKYRAQVYVISGMFHMDVYADSEEEARAQAADQARIMLDQGILPGIPDGDLLTVVYHPKQDTVPVHSTVH